MEPAAGASLWARHACLRPRARAGSRTRHLVSRRRGRPRRRAPTPAVAFLADRARRRHLGLAQPARVQRRQALPLGRQARRRAGGGDRGALRRRRFGWRVGREPRPTRRAPTSRTSSNPVEATWAGCASGSTAPTAHSPVSPRARSRNSARRCTSSAPSPTAPTSTSAAAPPTSRRCRSSSRARASTSASRSTATATACSRSTGGATSSTEIKSSPSSLSPSASTSSR